MPTVPKDGRPQFSFLDLAVANYLHGRPSLDEVQQIGPDRYILPNAWPKAPMPSGPAGPVIPSAPSTDQEAPQSAPAGRAIWPNLK
jgi:hypothetical protein